MEAYSRMNTPFKTAQPSLLDIQREFQQYLLSPEQHSHCSWAVNNNGLSAEKRLAIYEEAYRLRLHETLTVDFPALKSIAGDDLFKTWCDSYIDTHPSQHFSIRYFGQYFAQFLSGHHQTVFAELAHFEWLLSSAFDATDTASLTRDTLAQLPIEAWPTLQFTLHPSVHFLECKTNALQAWQQFTNEAVISEITNQEQPLTWLIWRQQLKIYFRSLQTDELAALRVVKNGGGWEAVCNGMARFNEVNAPQLAANFLNTWINDGLLSSSITC